MFFIFVNLISLIVSTFALPNFVIFLADDLGYGDVGCFGNSTIKTKNIDNLAKNGLKLNHHLAAAAVCTPSRAALLTGRYPIRSGMESSGLNKVFFFIAASGGLPQTEITIAQALKIKNYNTAIIGKWHLGNDCHRKGDGCHHPLNHGFDYFYGLPLSNFKDMGDDSESVITAYMPNFYSYALLSPILGLHLVYLFFRTRPKLSLFLLIVLVVIPILTLLFLLNLKRFNSILLKNFDVIEQPIKLKGLTQRFVKETKAYLAKQVEKDKPFFLYVPFVHVHTALFCADKFAGKSKHGRYGDNVEELDWAVGEIVGTLEKLKLLQNTFIYFSSDNGAHIEEVGADGQREGGYNGILRGGKMMGGMEGGIRVPSIISWPGIKKPGEINQTTSQMDILPTILELAGISLPKDRLIDGKSLVPLLKGESNKSAHEFLFHYCGQDIHAATYIQHAEHKVWKIHWTSPKFLPGTETCKYVCHCYGDFVIHHRPPLLYDITDDPSEKSLSEVNWSYYNIMADVEKAKAKHEMEVEEVASQFSFGNTIWKPWLQPCCNFPYCTCTDSSSTSL